MAEHGYSRYSNDGCRCDICRTANAAWMREYIRRPIDPDRHGTDINYRRGCRCDACRSKHNGLVRITATRRRHRDRPDVVAAALAKPARPPRPYRPARSSQPEHGTLTMYTHRRCRCEQCRAAMTAYAREYRARKRGVA